MTTANLLQLAPALKWLLPLADHAVKPGLPGEQGEGGTEPGRQLVDAAPVLVKVTKLLRVALSSAQPRLGLAPFDACHLLSSICWLFHLLYMRQLLQPIPAAAAAAAAVAAVVVVPLLVAVRWKCILGNYLLFVYVSLVCFVRFA